MEDKRLDKIFNQAIEYYEQGDLEASLEHFYLCLKLIENTEKKEIEENLLINIAQIYDEQGEIDKALRVYDLISLRHSSGAGDYGKAVLYEELNDYKNALIHYKKSLKVNPKNRDSLFFLANLYDVLGEYEKSVETYRKLLEFHPEDFMAYNNLGSIYEQAGDYVKAREALEKSIELEAEYFRSHFNLAITLERMEEDAKALKEYMIAKKLNPSYEDIYLNLSAFFIRRKEFPFAIEALKEGLENNPEAGNLYYNLAASYKELGLWENGIKALKKSLKFSPHILTFLLKDKQLRPLLERAFQKTKGDIILLPLSKLDKGSDYITEYLINNDYQDLNKDLDIEKDFEKLLNFLIKKFKL